MAGAQARAGARFQALTRRALSGNKVRTKRVLSSMHMVEQRIQQQFYESADLTVQLAESLARPISDAAAAVLGAITAGGKVLAFGPGSSFADAQRFVAAFVGRFERERPSLAAMVLGGDAALATALAESSSPEHPMLLAATKQLQALSAPGDVLLVIAADTPPKAIASLVAAAHDKEMSIIVLSGRSSQALAQALGETDVHIAVMHERVARIQEIHVLALHCLCDAVDLQLMGEQELN